MPGWFRGWSTLGAPRGSAAKQRSDTGCSSGEGTEATHMSWLRLKHTVLSERSGKNTDARFHSCQVQNWAKTVLWC